MSSIANNEDKREIVSLELVDCYAIAQALEAEACKLVKQKVPGAAAVRYKLAAIFWQRIDVKLAHAAIEKSKLLFNYRNVSYETLIFQLQKQRKVSEINDIPCEAQRNIQ